MSSYRPPEQRYHMRYRLKNTLFLAVQGDYFAQPACVTDLNADGVGCYSQYADSELTGKFIVLDLVSEDNRFILRSLPARIVFSLELSEQEENADDVSIRYGLQFVNLSSLKKRQLDLITKKYARREE